MRFEEDHAQTHSPAVEPTVALARPVPQQVDTGAITPAELLKLAIERGADIDKLERLLDLQARWEDRQAHKAYVSAMMEFKAHPPTVIKDKGASFGSKRADSGSGKRADSTIGYKYATLDQVSEKIAAELSKHGFSHGWEIEQLDGGMIRVTCILTHQQGHSERTSLQAGPDTSGSKNNIQAVGSTVTYLERYTLLAVTGLAAKDQDNDGGPPHGDEVISAEQKDQLIARIREVNADVVAFLRYMQVNVLDDLPAQDFDRAMAALDQKARKKETS